MKRTLAIGDIHGAYKALIQVLERAAITSEDTLIFLGDYVDGWSESAETIECLINLTKTNECHFILGNHDLWFRLWLEFGTSNPIWEENGGRATKESYLKTGLLTDETHKSFFKNLKNYYLDESNRLFIHAGFTSIHGVSKEEYESNYYFDRTLWEMALIMDNRIKKDSVLFPKRLKHYNEIFLGHTPTINFNKDVPMNAINIWNVDTGAAFTGKLSALDVTTKEFWQSDNVPTLYPREKGRN